MNPEVLIIGGGVIGLSIARELHRHGMRRIMLVEKGLCGVESSWAAAGMLGPQAEAYEGGTFFDMTVESRDLYPDFADELLDETDIDVELDRSGTLYLAFTDDDVREIRERYEWQQKAGFAVKHLAAEDARRMEPFVSPDVREALFLPNDWQVENRKLLIALRRFADRNGVEIRENARVDKLIVENGRVMGAHIETGRITADKTVLATGAWTSLIKLGDVDMPLKVEPVRGQIIAFRTAKKLFKRVIYSHRGYMVPRMDGRILAGSTSENVGFDRSSTNSATESLREMASEIAPNTGGLEIADRWAGLRPRASDGLPILGTLNAISGLSIATGHYRNGILLAPLTAKLMANNLVGEENSKFFAAFGPDRFGLRRAGTGS